MTTTTPMTTGRHAAVAPPVRSRSQASPIAIDALQRMATRQPLRKRKPALLYASILALAVNAAAIFVIGSGVTSLPQSWALLAAASLGAGTGLALGFLSARRANRRRARLAGDILRQLQAQDGLPHARTPE